MKKTLLLYVLFFTGLSLTNPCQVKGQVSQEKPVSRIVEDGGTGPYSAIMLTETTLQTHTVFRPEDLTPFGVKNKLPVIAWGNGACANSPWEHVNFLTGIHYLSPAWLKWDFRLAPINALPECKELIVKYAIE